jgi:phospholipid transport system transporter-binding protein
MFIAPARVRIDSMVGTEKAGESAIAQGEVDFDISPMIDVDSSAIALLLAWHRAALARTQPLKLKGAGAAVLELAELYGVADILHLRMAD